jgi:hypothetical protein
VVVNLRLVCLVVAIVVWVAVKLIESRPPGARLTLHLMDAALFLLVALYLGQ